MKITPGARLTVPGADRWYDAIVASKAFVGSYYCSGVAGQYSAIQLINPAASGVTAMLRYAFIGSTTAQYLYIGRYDTDLANDIGTGRNLVAGAAGSKCHIKTGNDAAHPWEWTERYLVPANESFPIANDWSWRLAAGQGIVLSTDSLNTLLLGAFKWIEESQ